MRKIVKKWGNGLAVRLPREHDEYGRLEEGDEVEIRVRPMRRIDPDWNPPSFEWDAPADLSVNHDEYIWGYLDEKFPSLAERTRRDRD